MTVEQPHKSHPWYVPNRFRVSPMNYKEEVQSLYNFPKKMVFQDGTIRKIDHTAGTRELSTEDKVEIARLIDAVGVTEMIFAPGLYSDTVKGASVREGMAAVCKAGLKLKVRAAPAKPDWVNGDYNDIDSIADSGVAGIDISLGGPILFGESGSATTPGMEGAVARALEYIRSKGLEAGVSLGAVGQTDPDDALKLANVWLDHGAGHFKMTDHFSELSPDAVRYLIRHFKKGLKKDVPIYFHAHDSFGMATACAVAACSAGAWPESGVNGFGDNGFASFEEIVMSLEMLYGIDTGIKLESLTELSRALEEITGFKNHPLKSVVGEALWVPSKPVQYKELLDGVDCVSLFIGPYEPEVVGTRISLMWSINSVAPLSVKVKLDRMGVPYDEDDVERIVENLIQQLRAIEKAPFWLSDSEVEEVCQQRLTSSKH